jgi:hypothetical protein
MVKTGWSARMKVTSYQCNLGLWPLLSKDFETYLETAITSEAKRPYDAEMLKLG